MSGELTKGGGGHRSETASTGPAPKRMRVSRACEQCRSRKAKCDGKTPACSPCVTLSQQCTYGAQPRKRGLPPGSVSALERTVKLLQRVLGLLIVSVEGSEAALLGLVQRCGRNLFDDGDEGDKLSIAWKGGPLPEALEKLRGQGQEPAERSSTEAATAGAGSPEGEGAPPVDLGLAQDHFREAIKAISSGERGKVGLSGAGGPRGGGLEGDPSGQQAEGSNEKDRDGDGDGIGAIEMDWVKESQSLQESHAGMENGMGRGKESEGREISREPLSATITTGTSTGVTAHANSGELPNIDHSLLTNNMVFQYQDHLQFRTVSPPPTATTLSALPTSISFPLIDTSDENTFSDGPISGSAVQNKPLYNPSISNQSFRPISYQQSSLDPAVRDDYSLPVCDKLLDDHIQLPSNSRLLLDIYFTYTHVWFPILDKYDLIRLFHVVSSSNSSAKRKAHPSKTQVPAGKRALLYAVLALATIQHEALPQSSSPETASSQRGSSIPPAPPSPSAATLYTAAQQLVFSPGEELCLDRVQALLLLSLVNIFLSHLSTAWLLIGHAGRVAVDINLKAETKSRFNTRTWFGYLVLETFISVRLGREPGVLERDWNVPAIEEDGWEEWDSWKGVSVAELQRKRDRGRDRGGSHDNDPAHILSVFNQLVGLSRLVRRIASLPPPLPPQQRSSHHSHNRSASNEDLSTPQTILRQLYSWNRELLPHCSFDILNFRDLELSPLVSTTPHISNLHLYYAHAILELHSRCPPRLFHDSFNGMNDLAPAAASSTAIILEHIRTSRSLAVLPCTFVHFAGFVSDTTSDDGFSPLGPLEKSISERVRVLKGELEAIRNTAASGFIPSNGLLKKAETKQELSRQAVSQGSNLPPPPPPQPRNLIDTRPRFVSQSDDSLLTGQLAAMSPSRLFTFTPPASMLSPIGNIPAPESDHFRRPSAFSASGIDTQVPQPPNNSQSQQTHHASSMTGGNIHPGTGDDPENQGGTAGISAYGAGTASSLSMSQTAPSPDGFDEEMGMLECLPWTHSGIPEFVQNLGYVGGFSPSAFQLGPSHEHQAPLQILGLRQDSTDPHADEGGGYDSGGAEGPGEGDEAGNVSGRRGLNTVLEQWLGDVLGAGGNGRW